jgi:hypothetical protein
LILAIVRVRTIAPERNAMSYTLASAAAACDVNKSTILRAIKSGKISETKDQHGEWHVEPAGLHRVYPPVADAAAGIACAAPTRHERCSSLRNGAAARRAGRGSALLT